MYISFGEAKLFPSQMQTEFREKETKGKENEQIGAENLATQYIEFISLCLYFYGFQWIQYRLKFKGVEIDLVMIHCNAISNGI